MWPIEGDDIHNAKDGQFVEGTALLPERERRIVTVPGHGELSPDEEEQMIAFMEYIFEKRTKLERSGEE
ncbi:hypothetical protein [Christensenella tenuis]|jgi:hypothetical protein|uniref:Uncharacterized protein n=1 Tax=Christensenella tenuis TaxID=2763033 RepID=A0ABR7EFG1_9FIRM|nr:hypothetical protein [Christensenella tenuis]MBC5648481.1 hypothetical protein [Christensenella tenuis]